MIAAQHDHRATVLLLLENGASLDKVDTKGWTALAYAAANRHANVVQSLLEKVRALIVMV